MAGQGVELLDPSLDVVSRDGLTLGDRVQIDVVENSLVVGQHLLGIVAPKADAEVRLGLEDGQP